MRPCSAGDDGNCADPVASTFEIPFPRPWSSQRRCPAFTFRWRRLGLVGHQAVHSFEEVLWLTELVDAHRYSCVAVGFRIHAHRTRI